VIITFPTALYKTVLPPFGGTGNVTWLISSTDPPRSMEPLQRVPDAELIREKDPDPYTPRQHRQAAGGLVFSSTTAGQSTSGTGMQQFEIGQVLQFETETLPTVTATPVPQTVELQHDLNLLDLADVGLTEEEAALLTTQSEDAKQGLEDEIAGLQVQIADVSVAIGENQKRINEARKVYDAAVVVQDQPIAAKVQARITALTAQRDQLAARLNELNVEVGLRYDELQKVAPLVR
jgi:hypothetical protein